MLPHAGLIKAIDPESGDEQWIDTEDPVFRKAYSEWFQNAEVRLKQIFGESKVDLINISTEEDYVKKLLKFFKSR